MRYSKVRLGGLSVLMGVLNACGSDSPSPGALEGLGGESPGEQPSGNGAGQTGGGGGDPSDPDVGFISDLDPDGTAPDELDPDSACAAESRQGDPALVALYFMVDISGSMLCPVPDADPSCEADPGAPYSDVTRWSETSLALKNFFAAPASAGVLGGIGFFPRTSGGGLDCGADDYVTPDAEIAPLPDPGGAVSVAIDAQAPGGNTPTVPALQGAIAHAESWATQNPDQQVVVVYATDGYPRGCGGSNDIAGAAQAAALGFESAARIRTYVLGVGSNLTDLNDIAAAGGTGQALFVDAGQDVTAQLTAALDTIRDAVAVDCAYTIPEPPPGLQLDPNLVNVQYTSGVGDVTSLARDALASDCNTGWQYSPDGNQIMLCGQTCDLVKGDPGARVDVLFGCQTVVEIQ